MYSICVRQHNRKPHRYTGFAILIGIKQYGIDESWAGIKLYKTKKEASDNFCCKVMTVINSNKDNEV